MFSIDRIDPYFQPLDIAMAIGIFLMGTGLGALIAKFLLAGRVRELKAEITDRLKPFDEAA